MPRIRSIKPEALQHRKLGKVSDRALRLWLGMLTQADDEGRLVADADHLRVIGFGYQPRVRAHHIDAALDELTRLGLVRCYGLNGTRYADFPSWKDHQKISHPTPSILPAFDPAHALIPEDSGALQSSLEHSASRARGSDRIRGIRSEGRERRTPPAPEDSGADGSAPPDGASPRPPVVVFRIPDSITEVLDRTPRFRGVRRLRTPEFWQPQFRAYSTLDFAGELTKAAAWCEANPRRAPKRDLPRFLHAWFRRAAADDADASVG